MAYMAKSCSIPPWMWMAFLFEFLFFEFVELSPPLTFSIVFLFPVNSIFCFSWLSILEHLFFSYFTYCGNINIHHICRNPTLAKCGGEAQHLEKLEVGSLPGLPNVQSSTARGKTPRIGVFLVSLERSWNVDIENALALAIRTPAAQVMGKRRAGSQTGSLTPDH